MRAFSKMLLYFFVSALAFYVLPLFVFDARTNIFLLLLILPLICVFLSCIFGILNRFSLLHLFLPLGIGIMFLPSAFLFYNTTALIYGAIYAVLSGFGLLLGNIIGYVIRRLSKPVSRSAGNSISKSSGRKSAGNQGSTRPSGSKAATSAASKAATSAASKAATSAASKSTNKATNKSTGKKK